MKYIGHSSKVKSLVKARSKLSDLAPLTLDPDPVTLSRQQLRPDTKVQLVCQREITPEILVILCTYIPGGRGWQLAAFSVASVCITQAPITLLDGDFGIGQLSCSLDRRYRLFHNSRLPS